MARVSIQLDDEVAAAIKQLARGSGLSQSAWIKRAVAEKLAASGSDVRAVPVKDGDEKRDVRVRLPADEIAAITKVSRRMGEAIAAVTSAGANIVSGPNLSVADPEKANLGAYGVAYKAARAKAEAYASAAGLRIARVLSIRDGGEGGYMPQMGDMEARMVAPPPVVAQASAPPVLAGTNASVVTVRVDFALEAR